MIDQDQLARIRARAEKATPPDVWGADIPALLSTIDEQAARIKELEAEAQKLREPLLYFIQCENDGLEDDDLDSFSEQARAAIGPLVQP